jgi:hypothetical protein
MCVIGKPRKPENPKSKTRVFVMERSSGRLYEGLMPTKDVKKLQLRENCSCDISGMKQMTDYKLVFEHKKFMVQPEEFFKKRGVSFADLV